MKTLLENLVAEQKQVVTQEEQRIDVLDGELQQLRGDFDRLKDLGAEAFIKAGQKSVFQKAIQYVLHWVALGCLVVAFVLHCLGAF